MRIGSNIDSETEAAIQRGIHVLMEKYGAELWVHESFADVMNKSLLPIRTDSDTPLVLTWLALVFACIPYKK